MSLATPEKIQRLQGSLYDKAKREPECRFHFLYDKIHREDVLAHAYQLCRSNRGAPGVDGQRFEEIEAEIIGRETLLAELGERFGEPELYKDVEALSALKAKMEQAKAELAALNAEWEERAAEQ